MFLRSARNAGFRRSQRANRRRGRVCQTQFRPAKWDIHLLHAKAEPYSVHGRRRYLALAHAGLHHSRRGAASRRLALAHPFDQYDVTIPGQSSDRYHYGLFNCCQAMYQLGGKYWEQFYPPAVEAVLANQQADGSWPADSAVSRCPVWQCLHDRARGHHAWRTESASSDLPTIVPLDGGQLQHNCENRKRAAAGDFAGFRSTCSHAGSGGRSCTCAANECGERQHARQCALGRGMATRRCRRQPGT